MFEVGTRLPRALKMVVGAGLLAASVAAPGMAQSIHRENNAAREARIAKTVHDTYSHKWEIFGGGGGLRFQSGENTKRNTEVNWVTEANYYLNERLAIVGSAQGSFGHAHAQADSSTIQAISPQINEYFFMGGASYRFYRKEKFAFSAEVLAGDGWGIFSGGAKGLSGTQVGLWQDGSRPAFEVAPRMDYNFYPNLAFRVQPMYIFTNFKQGNGNSGVQADFGVNAGIVYRFGRQ